MSNKGSKKAAAGAPAAAGGAQSSYSGQMEGITGNNVIKGQNPQLTVTMGQNKGAVDAHMSAANESQENKKGAAKIEGQAGAPDVGKSISKLKDPNQAHEVLDIPKNVPQARFGHTITMVNKYKVVLFGGATGDTGKYSMTGETFIFNMLLRTWTELNGKFWCLLICIL